MVHTKSLNIIDRFSIRQLRGDHIKKNLFDDWSRTAHSLYKKDLLAHYGCVNAVEFADNGQFFVSGEYFQQISTGIYTYN